MNRHALSLSIVLLAACAGTVAKAAEDSPSKAIRVDAGAVPWQPAPASLPGGARMAVLEGDPRGTGFFTVRVSVPSGSTLPPHWHPSEERVTVLSGAVELGFGSVADRTTVTRLGAGSFYVNPPREMHFIFFPEDTVLQMTGIGPWLMERSDIAAPSTQATGSVRIVKVEPEAGSKLSAGRTITVTVEYEIHGFRPDTFLLSLQFDTLTAGRTIGGTVSVTGSGAETPAPPPRETLKTRSGRATVTSDLRFLRIHDEIRHPLRARVFLQELKSPTSSRVVASSDAVEFTD
jgi:quercetin dioxygenase-like cupin family protein